MSLTASAHSVPGMLRQEVLIDGRHRLVTDEPESVGGVAFVEHIELQRRRLVLI